MGRLKEIRNYLGLSWRYETEIKLHGKYEGWTGFVFYPADKDNKFVDADYIMGKFNKLNKNVHIAVEDVAFSPKSKKDINSLFVAKKNGTDWPEKIPEWSVNYE